MANIKKSAVELIGKTPLLEAVNYEKANQVEDLSLPMPGCQQLT